YDVALDFQGNIKGTAHVLFCGAHRRIGFTRPHCRELSHLFTGEHVPLPDGPIHRVDMFLHLAAHLGVGVNGANYRLPDSPESRRRLDAFLAEHGLSDGRYVAIHPGTSEFGREKRWLPERFGSLAEHLGTKHGLRSVVTWGPGEHELAESVVAHGADHAVVAMRTDSLLDLAEIIRRALVYVGCDSGPLHLASAVEVPSVALFGPKDPRVYGPRSPKRRVVFKPDPRVPNGTMNAITVADVRAAVEELIC
ncbi:MAG: glycosyltransferase family 9 protein, partial [Planctomycetota bacterium]